MLPASLRRIRQGAFCKCESLKVVKFSEGLTVLGTDEYTAKGNVFRGVFDRSALESVELSKTLKRIEYSAFKGCRNLKDILLPVGLEFIGKEAFCNTKLAGVSIPASVLKIEKRAFYKAELRRVTFGPGSRLTSVGDKAFGGNGML